MPGPPKKPTHLEIVQGCPGKRAINKNEPQPTKGYKPPPLHLSEQARQWYVDLCEELNGYGVMTELDSLAAVGLVMAYEEFLEISALIEKRKKEKGGNGYTYESMGSGGDMLIKANPEIAQRNQSWEKVAKMLREFGMTPASRTKVQVTKPDEADILNDIMARK